MHEPFSGDENYKTRVAREVEVLKTDALAPRDTLVYDRNLENMTMRSDMDLAAYIERTTAHAYRVPAVGELVRAHGLRHRPALNGAFGEIVTGADERGFATVRFAGVPGEDGPLTM